MNDPTQLMAHELRRHHSRLTDDRIAREREVLVHARRRDRRSRLARRLRSAADRLES